MSEEKSKKVKLHIRYNGTKNLRGFIVDEDTITFSDLESVKEYANGNVVYDILDNTVKKRPDEILLYAENEDGEIIWETDEVETFDGHKCVKEDEWQSEEEQYLLAKCIEDSTFFYSRVLVRNGQWKGNHIYEYDRKPSRKEVEDRHLDHVSAMDIDRYEAEYGADGSRNFPYLNETEEETMQRRRKRMIF